MAPSGILAQSRGTSVVMLVSYGLWLLFQIKTNGHMFKEPPKRSLARNSMKRAAKAFANIGAASAAASGGDFH